MPGTLGHLTARFFDAMRAGPLTEQEAESAGGWLEGAESGLFFAQPVVDQRHGYHAATVVAALSDDPVAIRAALLHDVGKRHSRLGIVGRSLASVMIRLRLPLPPRVRAYRDHGELGAAELAGIGSDPVVVEFARHHHGDRPHLIPGPVWELLQSADAPPKPRWLRRAGIT